MKEGVAFQSVATISNMQCRTDKRRNSCTDVRHKREKKVKNIVINVEKVSLL